MAGARSVNPRRRALISLAALVTVVFFDRSASAARFDLRAIIGPEPQRYADALRALRDRLGEVPIEDVPRRARRMPPPTAYIALGPAALQSALEARLDAPLVSLFTSRQAYERSIAAAPGTSSTAIYAEPNPEHQMRLIAALYRRPIAVGMILSDGTARQEPALREAAAAHGLRLEAALVQPGAGLTRTLNRLESATVLLIQPDSDLYTPATLRELLESTYRRRLPVVGFSAALVAAGTLASAYSSAADTVAQLEALLEQIANRRMPAPRYPAYWRVAVNDSVARSLDVVVDDAVRTMGDRP